MDFVDRIFDPLASLIGTGLANLVAALVILIVGYIVARLIERGVVMVLRRLGVDNRLAEAMGSRPDEEVSVEQATGRLVFYILMLFVLLAFFQKLNLTIVTDPLNRLLSQIAAFVPNLIAAAIIVFVGYVLARIFRGLTTNIAAGLGADRLAERVGLKAVSLASLVGTVVYALILIPALIAALNALDIAAISDPASDMLRTFLEAIPAIFGAAVLLAITYFVGRIIADIATDLLAGLGFDDLVGRLGIGQVGTGDAARTPSEIAGAVVLVAIVLFAAVEAAALLGFDILATIISDFIVFGGRVLLAVIIMAIGFYLANMARNLIAGGREANAQLMATAARWAILVFSGAIALRQLGVADEIITLAFGLTLGAIAVAAALAFGLGSRDIARREVEHALTQMRSDGTAESEASETETPGTIEGDLRR